MGGTIPGALAIGFIGMPHTCPGGSADDAARPDDPQGFDEAAAEELKPCGLDDRERRMGRFASLDLRLSLFLSVGSSFTACSPLVCNSAERITGLSRPVLTSQRSLGLAESMDRKSVSEADRQDSVVQASRATRLRELCRETAATHAPYAGSGQAHGGGLVLGN